MLDVDPGRRTGISGVTSITLPVVLKHLSKIKIESHRFPAESRINPDHKSIHVKPESDNRTRKYCTIKDIPDISSHGSRVETGDSPEPPIDREPHFYICNGARSIEEPVL